MVPQNEKFSSHIRHNAFKHILLQCYYNMEEEVAALGLP